MQNIIEEWRDVLGYEGWYSVSNLGRVRRDMGGKAARSGLVISQHQRPTGYCTVCLSKHNIHKTFTVHKLVSRAFIGECPLDKEVNHIDADKGNNAALNLEYLTRKANVKHAWDKGLVSFKGIRNGRAKLNEEKVICIKRFYREKRMNQTELGKKFGVHNSIISMIVNNKIWNHVN